MLVSPSEPTWASWPSKYPTVGVRARGAWDILGASLGLTTSNQRLTLSTPTGSNAMPSSKPVCGQSSGLSYLTSLHSPWVPKSSSQTRCKHKPRQPEERRGPMMPRPKILGQLKIIKGTFKKPKMFLFTQESSRYRVAFTNGAGLSEASLRLVAVKRTPEKSLVGLPLQPITRVLLLFHD